MYRIAYRSLIRSRRLASMVAVAGLLAACGGSASPPAAQRTTTDPQTSVSPTTTPSRTGTPRGGATAKPTAKGSKTTPTPKATTTGGAVARLDQSCGRRGVDTQGVTVTTQPEGPVGFNTQYSDGSSNVDGVHHYSGGYGGGFADGGGTYRNTWIVPDNAPLGMATIRMITADGSLELTYLVVARNGSCP
jgi:hypothetical protein